MRIIGLALSLRTLIPLGNNPTTFPHKIFLSDVHLEGNNLLANASYVGVINIQDLEVEVDNCIMRNNNAS